MNVYVSRVVERLTQLYSGQPEYLQSVMTWLELIGPALDDPRYEKLDLLTRMVEPERMVSFLVPWTDDKGVVQPRLPCPVQQRHRPLQRRPALPSLRQRGRSEIPWF